MPRTDPAADVSKLAQVRQAERVRGRLMKSALVALLNKVEGARAVLPHLSALEAALGRRGTAAVDEVPAHWLPRIIKQLSSLPVADDEHELQDLLSRLCRALARHQLGPQGPSFEAATAAEPQPDMDESTDHGLKFSLQDKIDVQELGHSTFLEEFATIAAAAEVADTPTTAPARQRDTNTETADFELQPR